MSYLYSYFSKMMVLRLGKFRTTNYHSVYTWVSEWVSEWSFVYQSPQKIILQALGTTI